MNGTSAGKGEGLARWGTQGQAPWCLQRGCTHSRERRQLLPLQAAPQRPPAWWEQSRETKARAWHLKGSKVPSSGQEGPGQSYRAQLHGTCQSRPWREACCGVQGEWCWAGITQGLAGARAGGCREGEWSWGGIPQGPADPGAEGCRGTGAVQGSPRVWQVSGQGHAGQGSPRGRQVPGQGDARGPEQGRDHLSPLG